MTAVISADSHVVEAAEVFTGLPERFGDAAPRVMYENTVDDAIIIPAKGKRGVRRRMAFAGLRVREGAVVERRPGHKPDVDVLTEPGVAEILDQGYAGMREGIRNGAARGECQDIDGVAAEFLYPGFFGLFSFDNPELLVACQKNYNDWLHDYCSESGGRLHGLAAIPVQDPAAAVAELARVIALGYRGGCIPCTSPADAPYFDDRYEPIWVLAEEAGFPLSMHVGTNAYVPPEQRQKQTRRDSIVDYAGATSSIQGTLVELICRGVASRHPNLRFVVAEFNAGWIAHWLDRVDQGLLREYRFRSEEFTGERPQEIWARQFYATIEDDRPAILTRELIGVDNLMWGSDYPHVDSTWPCSADVLDELMVDVPADERGAITHDNVRRLYGLV